MISDYSANVSTKHEQIIEVLQNEQIPFKMQRHSDWTDFERGNTDYSDFSEQALTNGRKLCNSHNKPIYEGRMYGCPVSLYSQVSGTVELNDAESIELDKITDKLEILDFVFYHSQPYYAFCKYCNGWCVLHFSPTEVAKQMDDVTP
jgi:hypothetical protein